MIRRILIVEPDSKVAQELFHLFHFEYGRFESERYETEIAVSVAEAIELSQAVAYHCIIIDVSLPEMDGYEAIPLMRTINNNPPVIITTGKNTLELETKVRQQEVYYYHIRSFGLEELKTVTQGVFENLQKAKLSKKSDLPRPKPVVLKQLRLYQSNEKQE